MGGKENFWYAYVCSGGHSVAHVPSGDLRGEEDLSHVCSWECSLTNVPLQGLGGEKRISGMYAVGDA